MKLDLYAELIHPKILLLTFDTQLQMNKTLIRIQEHYENPVLAGQVFTLGTLRQQLIQSSGTFTYYTDVHGCNFTSNCLTPFINGLFDPLTPEEAAMVELIKTRTDDYYVIAVFEDGEEQETTGDTLTHEICHAMFSVFPDYRAEVLDTLELFSEELVGLKANLLDDGYSINHVLDECHAYIIEGDVDYAVDFDKDLQLILQSLYHKYATNNGIIDKDTPLRWEP